LTDPITIDGDGQRVCFEGLPPDVAGRLSYPAWELAPAKYGVRAAYRRRALLREGPGRSPIDKALVGARGVEGLATRLLRRSELRYTRRIERPVELPAPELDAFPRTGPIDSTVLHAVRRHHQIQIRLRAAVDAARVAVQIPIGYPKALITIAVQHIREARRVIRLLRAAGIEGSLATSKDLPGNVARVVVVTYGQLGSLAARLHRLDLLVVLDGVAALGKVPRSYLTPLFSPEHYRVPRLIGLVRADRHLAPADLVGLVELFGPEWMTVPAHGWVERPVEVVAAPFDGGAASFSQRLITRKRRNLWHHRLRNRFVARVARSLSAGDRGAFLADVPRLADVRDLPRPASIVVVVEGREHADALAAELQGWPIDSSAPGWTISEIATFDGLRRRSLHDIDAVIRADGGTGVLPLAPAALASPSDQPARALVVIDIRDRHHPELRAAVRARTKTYFDAGWRPAGCDAVDFALLTLFPESDCK